MLHKALKTEPAIIFFDVLMDNLDQQTTLIPGKFIRHGPVEQGVSTTIIQVIHSGDSILSVIFSKYLFRILLQSAWQPD